MKRVLILLFLVGTAINDIVAGNVKGKVVDKAKQPIEFVNLSVYKKGQKNLIKGTISDLEGNFNIDGLGDGTYTLSVSYMGYVSVNRDFTLSAQNNHSVNLHSIILQEDSKTLQEVNVVAQKSSMKLDIDKKVFNLDQNLAAVGGSASEALETIPSVEVDSEGNVSLRGSQSVTIWINGKAQGMTSDNRGDILQQMPAESIEKIEVITNPSSKYSPEGSAGIINIILKRDRKAGYYGGVKASGLSTGGGRLGANINYSSGVFDAYANVGYGHRVHKNGTVSNRTYLGENGNQTGFLNSDSKGKNIGNNVFVRAGFTWHFTKKDDISFGYMGMFGHGHRRTNIDYIGSEYTRDRFTHNISDMNMNHFDFGYRHEWKTSHTLDFNVSRSGFNSDMETSYTQNTQFIGGDKVNSLQSQDTKINPKSWEIKLDYEQPIGSAGKVEAGYNGRLSKENSPVFTYADLAKTDIIKSLYNRFVYNQDIHAVYANFQSRIGEKFGYQLGLRGEYWKVDAESRSYEQEFLNVDPTRFKKDYFALFPTAFLSYQLPHNQELQVNYTRRLSRPWGGQMNSFKNISDSTNISYGNPQLTPEYTNSFELNYIKNWEAHTLSFSGYYRPTTDVIQNISYVLDGIRYSTNENIAKSLSSGVEIISKNKLFKILDLTTTLNLFYYKLDGGNFNYILDNGMPQTVTVLSDDNFSWNAQMMASFMLPYSISFQATGRYDAERVITQGKRKSSYMLDLGLRKTFFDKKFTVAINARDLLDSRKMRSITSGNGYTQDSESWRGGRRFSIQLSYSFGNMRAKAKKGKPQPDGAEGQPDYNGNVDD